MRWILVALVWLVPLGSIYACPYDLHGVSTCSSAAQFGRTTSFYLVAPGLWLGSMISNAISKDPLAGASFGAIALGCAIWLTLLSGLILFAPRLLKRAAGR